MVISQGESNDHTSLFFYLRQPIDWVDGHSEMQFATRSLGIGRDHYLSPRTGCEGVEKFGTGIFNSTAGLLAGLAAISYLNICSHGSRWNLRFGRDSSKPSGIFFDLPTLLTRRQR